MSKSFLVTADIHVGFRKDVDHDWQLNRYKQLFSLLTNKCLEYKSDLIIAGDLFDKCEPELKELQVVFEWLRELKEAGVVTYLIGGNHETISVNVDTFSFLDVGHDKTINVHYGRNLEHCKSGSEVTLHFLNHCDLSDMYDTDTWWMTEKNILITHVRPTLNQFIQEEVDVQALIDPFDLVIAGDIHQPIELYNSKLWYTGQPINSVFSAEQVNTGFIRLNIMDDGTWTIHREFTNMLPKLVKHVIPANDWEDYQDRLSLEDYHHVHVSGTAAELRPVKNHQKNVKLIKVVQEAETFIDLTDEEADTVNHNIPEEEKLGRYLETLGHSADKIGRLMGVLQEVG